jgi:SAM-dependent methyltransferase
MTGIVLLATQEQWQLSMKAAELYERYPARYILGPWAPLLVDAARAAAGERVLDVACGTGVVARAAAKRVGRTGRVVGVDLNPGMIAVARSLPATSDAPIEWLERSALDPRLDSASFDVVLCQQGPDRGHPASAVERTRNAYRTRCGYQCCQALLVPHRATMVAATVACPPPLARSVRG